MSTQQEFPSDIDKEVIKLCRAINFIPGLHTTSSCSGHGRDAFQIWIKADSIQELYVLARCLDRRYCCPTPKDSLWPDWHLRVTASDMQEDSISFCLINLVTYGESAYQEADKIADLIMEFVRNDKFMKMFGYKGAYGWDHSVSHGPKKDEKIDGI